MNITHQELVKHLNDLGFDVEVQKHQLESRKHHWTRYCAEKDEMGVRFRWIACKGDRDLCSQFGLPPCPVGEHVHLDVSLRTGAGGRYCGHRSLFVPQTLNMLDGYRGAPPKRKLINRGTLPEPHQFNENRFVAEGRQYIHTGVIASVHLVDVVGIQDDAKIDASMAAKPGEPAWFHFDCVGHAGATFDLITNGDVWHPINRKSRRITTQLKPKKSVDLTNMSIVDQEFLLAVIEDYVSRI